MNENIKRLLIAMLLAAIPLYFLYTSSDKDYIIVVWIYVLLAGTTFMLILNLDYIQKHYYIGFAATAFMWAIVNIPSVQQALLMPSVIALCLLALYQNKKVLQVTR